MHKKYRLIKSSLALFVGAALASPAYAAEDADTEESTGLNTITITAQKQLKH